MSVGNALLNSPAKQLLAQSRCLSSMQFQVDSVAASGGRSGQWICPDGEQALQTPGCMLYTRSGAVPNLGMDLLGDFTNLPAVSHISMASAYERPSTSFLQKLNKTCHEFYGLDKVCPVSYMSVQDSTQCLDPTFNGSKIVSVPTISIRYKFTADLFMEFVKVAGPTVYECLCDTLPSTFAASTSKRAAKSVDRTIDFLDRCLEVQRTSPALEHSAILGVIEGGSYVEHRVRSAKLTAQRPVAGFVVEGLEIGEDHLESTAATVQALLAELPSDKPRVFHGPVSPEDILRLVECGIDVFDSTYPYVLSTNGLAINLITASPSGEVSDLAEPSADAVATASTNINCSACNTRPSSTLAESSSGSDCITGESPNRHTAAAAAAAAVPAQRSSWDPSLQSTPASASSTATQSTPPPKTSTELTSASPSGEERQPEIGCAVANPDSGKLKDPDVALQRSIRPFEADLKQKRFEDDFRPLSPNCQCPACSGGCTRAYVHHLLHNGELLAGIHLMQHNLFHYLSFFEAVRKALSIPDNEEQIKAWDRLKMQVHHSLVV